MSWQISPEGRQRAFELLYGGHLADLNLEGLALPLPNRMPDKPSANNELHASVLVDLYALVEEMRFEIAFGSMVLVDFEAGVAAGTVTRNDPADDPFSRIGLPVEVLPVLRHYSRSLPPPDVLLDDPYHHIPGHRVLGTWFAGQLFDSALFRGISALDRLATLLWTRAEKELPVTKAGKTLHPSFTTGWLKELAFVYQSCQTWPELMKLSEDPLVARVRFMRDTFTHRVRTPAQLHGAHLTAFESTHQIVQGTDPETHEAFALALYDAVLKAAADLVSRLFSERFSALEPAGP
jgi:hypothetical protein